jgi:hypothetical protein
MSKELSVFDSLRAQIVLHVAPVAQMMVTDVASGQQAIAAVKAVKEYIDQLDEKRTGLVKPLNDQVKRINAYAKDIEGPLLAAERHIKAQLVAFEEGQERIRQAERRKEEERLREIQRAADEERNRINAEIAAKHRAEQEALSAQVDAEDPFGAEDDDTAAVDRKVLEQLQAIEAAEVVAKLDREAAVRASEAKARQYDIDAGRLKNTKKAWKAEAIDLALVPRQYLIITLNTDACLAAARGGITDIPGVKLWQETQVSIGATTSLKALT